MDAWRDSPAAANTGKKSEEVTSTSPPPPRPKGVRPFVLDHTLPTGKAPKSSRSWRPSDPGMAAIVALIRAARGLLANRRVLCREIADHTLARVLAVLIALAWWVGGFGREYAAWHYLGLGAAVWMAAHWTFRWWTETIGEQFRGWRYFVPAAPAIAAMILFARVDAYSQTWTSIKAPSTGETFELEGWRGGDPDLVALRRVVYLDSHKRWDDGIYWREIYSYAPGSAAPDYHSAGPMTPSNKPHGHWSGHFWTPYKAFDQWYWYGDEISEGEWELRGRR